MSVLRFSDFLFAALACQRETALLFVHSRQCDGARLRPLLAIWTERIALLLSQERVASVVSLEFVEEQMQILRLTTPELKDVRGPVRSE